jgi:hypothetical protein
MIKKYSNTPEIVLGSITKMDVPEVKVHLNRSSKKPFLGKITSSKNVADFIRSTYGQGNIELQEHSVVLYLNNAGKILGYYKHTTGGLSSTIFDVRLILGVALKCAAVSIILAHNHPGGRAVPSEADQLLTTRIKDAAEVMDIRLLDHIIITKNNYYSFADEELLGIDRKNAFDFNMGDHVIGKKGTTWEGVTGIVGFYYVGNLEITLDETLQYVSVPEEDFERIPLPKEPSTPLSDNMEHFVQQVEEDLQAGYKHNKTSIEKIAAGLQITDRTEIKELTELAIVRVARKLAHSPGDMAERYNTIVKLYNNQVTLSYRTSQSILLQQYSTPAPIAYLMGVFCGLDRLQLTGGYAFEPSAGNGLLTIVAKPERVYVNEIDEIRNRNLQTQGFANVFKRDGTKKFSYIDLSGTFTAVLTNPPFGRLDKPVDYNGFPIKELDHLMALRGLDTMTPDGKAAIIIGGHTRWDAKERIQAGKNRIFFNYLYHHYYINDVIQLDGKKLYTRQGTGFPVRLILIHGRKLKPEGHAPLKTSEASRVIRSFDELFDRVIHQTDTPSITSLAELEKEAIELLNTYFLPKKSDKDKTLEKIDFNKLYKRYKELNLWTPGGIILWKSTFPSVWMVLAEDADFLASVYKTLEDFTPTNQKVKFRIGLFPDKDQREIVELIQMYGRKPVGNTFESKYLLKDEELGMPYVPASQSCVVLNTQVPDSMGFETHQALARIKAEVGGDIDNFVRHRLGYKNQAQLCKALSAEQIDAVAVAIYNIEARSQGTIIGDQTGIGKGRIAAAMLRYGSQQGLKPAFVTEKANLFSDIYRDLYAIGSGHLKPFIINGRESKTDIKDEDGNIIYQAPAPTEQAAILDSLELPAGYDFEVGTYSQFNSPEKKPQKPLYLKAITRDNLLVMDEAHNSSGSSNTGEFMQSVVRDTKCVVFLSATFAKRPDNMPIYAMKTCISDANMTKDELVEAITKGGVALQEIISSQLVAEGQMIRRERSFEGVEVNYIALEELETEHKAIADNITFVLRDIIAFQTKYIDKEVDELDKIAAVEGKETNIREGTSQAGVDNQPYFSKVFNVINQMLFSIKADAVADRAIARLKEGKKPIIAFASTMGSFIEQMENEQGMPVGDGDLINNDFSEVLRRGLHGVMRYTERGIDGQPEYKSFEIGSLSKDAQNEYHRILERIDTISTGISISPIDLIVKKLEGAGYSVAEVTGRKYSVQPNWKGNKGLVQTRKKINTNDAFRQFNNNQVDVLMINQSGSTGASAHAIVTPKVPAEQVRQRVMIVLQAELDINTEVQKRGRINRTGQILKPIYDYVISAIPAEKRLMMMLQKKLKSLDANTTSNQKQSTKILDVPDFLNKYGDKVVKEYLQENKEINELLGDPLGLKKTESESTEHSEDAAHRVSGRVAVLSTQMQSDFYNEITERYNDYVDYLKQIGEYDLEVEAFDLQAETLSKTVLKVGKGGESAFGEDSILEKVRANVLKKPFSAAELDNLISESLTGNQSNLVEEYQRYVAEKLKADTETAQEKYNSLVADIPNEKKIQKLVGTPNYDKAIRERTQELKAANTLTLEQLEKGSHNRQEYLTRILKFFTVGRKLNYPIVTYDNGQENIMAVSLGVMIDKKKKNPYAPSAVKVRIAIGNSSKYIAMPASFSEGISRITAASHQVETPAREQLLAQWSEQIKESTKDRTIRYIITGNLLQAFGSQSGKLVSYTTLEGQTRKGILTPEEWQPPDASQLKITVPIIKALPLLKSLAPGSGLQASSDLSFFKTGDNFRVVMPAARSRAGDIFLDTELLPLVENNRFEKISDRMQGTVTVGNIEAFAVLLQNKHGINVLVGQHMLTLIADNQERVTTRRKIALPPPPSDEPDEPEENENEQERIRILELEAEALLLELELI